MKSDIRIWLAIVLLAIATAAYIAMTRNDTEPINGILVNAACFKGW